MNVRDLGTQVLTGYRKSGRATLQTGISQPVPQVAGGQVRLWYLLYRSQLELPYQVMYEPFARVAVDYATGQIVEHQDLPTSQPPRPLGRYPHAEAARIPHDRWGAVWDELWALYPDVIDAFAGRPAPGQRDKVRRFAELQELTAPPFMAALRQSLNPAFFDWLKRASGSVRQRG